VVFETQLGLFGTRSVERIDLGDQVATHPIGSNQLIDAILPLHRLEIVRRGGSATSRRQSI
jgi:hypothetical protein